MLSFIIILVMSFAAWKLIQENKYEETANIENNTKGIFSSKTVPSGSDNQYDIKLTMNSDGKFQIESTVNIKNTSENSWENLVFYFIPNIFTKSTSELLNNSLDVAGTVQFNNIAVEEIPVDYTLDKDTLILPLEKAIKPGDEVKVDFSYEFTLPEGGFRFTKSNENYHLAQFYPMVATFRENKWNKEDYRFKGETYHTGFSDFTVSYDIPSGYTFVSTSENDKYPSKTNGTFEVNNVKEIFIAILKDPMITQKQVGDVNIRVFGFDDNEDLYNGISEVASDALNYFQENIGPYPFTQLDIVIDNQGMEYPGIITAYPKNESGPINPNALKNIVVHEIAHQWFYGVISNDPFYDAWLDEGFASFSGELYFYAKSKKEIPYEFMYEMLDKIESLPVNLPLDQYENSSHIYGKSSTMLWSLFENRGGVEEAEKFLKIYHDFYKYKEVNTEEFVRFAQHYFNLEDSSEFKRWLEIKE